MLKLLRLATRPDLKNEMVLMWSLMIVISIVRAMICCIKFVWCTCTFLWLSYHVYGAYLPIWPATELAVVGVFDKSLGPLLNLCKRECCCCGPAEKLFELDERIVIHGVGKISPLAILHDATQV